MKLRQFPLLTDENVDPDVVAGLENISSVVLEEYQEIIRGRNAVYARCM